MTAPEPTPASTPAATPAATLASTIAAIGPLDGRAIAAARARLDILTKPPGSLGRLEDVVAQLAGITGSAVPTIEDRAVVIMAGDHGVVAQGVSAFPSAVTGQMVENFLAGGAAISVLSRLHRARIVIADFGVAVPPAPREGLLSRRIGPGTRDFSREPAMTRDETLAAIEAGIGIAADLAGAGCRLIVPGEMGIGNSTSAAAIVAALTGQPAAAVTGRGTGLDDAGVAHKSRVIDAAIALHGPDPTDPVGVLAALGGFEIAGLVGLLLGAAARRVAVVLDGFIVGAAALVAVRLSPAAGPYLIAGHRSVERGHRILLEELGMRPLLDLDMRLGEGSGAAVALGVIDAAVALQREMATFVEAAVDDGSGVTGAGDPAASDTDV
jgi:nicotinate-nucleotide--dimethylbenzimidazole phosphoribosyltransferase